MQTKSNKIFSLKIINKDFLNHIKIELKENN